MLAGSYGEAWRAGATIANERAAEIRARAPTRTLSHQHAKLVGARWIKGLAVHHGMNMHPALRGRTLTMPGELQLLPDGACGPTNARPEDANERAWWST